MLLTQVIAPHSVLTHWVGTCFDWPCSFVDGFGRLYLHFMAVGWSCLMQVPGGPSIHVSWLTPASMSLRKPSPFAFTLTGGGRFNAWHLRHPSPLALPYPVGLGLSPGTWGIRTPWLLPYPMRLGLSLGTWVISSPWLFPDPVGLGLSRGSRGILF